MSLPRATEQLRRRPRPTALVVTGAGLSAASGIPTFRGPEGYWTVGSREYRPEELATRSAFEAMPAEVWSWYLYRRDICARAAPNVAHQTLAQLEERLGDRFHLVTQNVDGLHLRAGNSPRRTYLIHGSIELMRCLDSHCADRVQPVPDDAPRPAREETLAPDELARLRCRTCGSPTRPHVLWFDEYYDEALYRAQSALAAAARADVVITVGSSGATNLPHQIVRIAAASGAVLIDVNPEPNPFAQLAEHHADGAWVRLPATEALPALLAALE